MRPSLTSIALRLWPGLARLNEDQRKSGIGSVVGFVVVAPFALAGLAWLVSATDPAVLPTRWPALALALALVLALVWLAFSFMVEIAPGSYSEWRVSLEWVIVWSATLLFGPGALWLAALPLLVSAAVCLWRSPTGLTRWAAAYDLSLRLAQATFASWIALAVYRGLGGVFPLAGLGELLPALAATAVRWLVAALLAVPGLVQFALDGGLGGHHPRRFVRFCVAILGWHALLDPFAILAACLYAQSGLGGYLFLAAGLLLASLVAHELSRAVERGQHRARELEKLEQFGRALIGMALDSSVLPQALKAHVAVMFPHSRMDVILFPDQVLLHHPAERPPLEAVAWEWLRSTAQPRVLLPGQQLPWNGQRLKQGIVAVPILEFESTLPVGGIYLARAWRPRDIANTLPAVQALAAEISSALHSVQVSAQRLAQERVEQELTLAGQIQAGFLPKRIPQRLGNGAGWSLAAALHPARETSGDFYDVFPLPNSRYAIVVADVADKGMGAALYMALSRTLVRTYAVEYHSRPDFVMKVTNRRILMDSDATMFVTLFYGVLDPHSGTLAYCNAGHTPPILFRAQDPSQAIPLTKTGMALGVGDNQDWSANTVEFAPGDALVLCTDGIPEACDPRGTMFGDERLVEAARAHLGSSAQGLLEGVVATVRAFTGDAPQADDITVMVIIREPSAQPVVEDE